MRGPGEHAFRATDAVGGTVLLSWRDSNPSGDEWEECLCLEGLGRGEWRLVVAGEGIDFVDESIPFDQEPDEDGELPDELRHRGRPVVRVYDTWEYDDSQLGLVQYDDTRCWVVGPGDYENAIRVLRDEGLDTHPDWKAMMRRLRMALMQP